MSENKNAKNCVPVVRKLFSPKLLDDKVLVTYKKVALGSGAIPESAGVKIKRFGGAVADLSEIMTSLAVSEVSEDIKCCADSICSDCV